MDGSTAVLSTQSTKAAEALVSDGMKGLVVHPTAQAPREDDDRKKQTKKKPPPAAVAAAAAATTTTAKRKTTVKSKKRLEEERAVAFQTVHRTLLSPVTHLSPANGGRPHDPAVFTKFAKPAVEKVGVSGRVMTDKLGLVAFVHRRVGLQGGRFMFRDEVDGSFRAVFSRVGSCRAVRKGRGGRIPTLCKSDVQVSCAPALEGRGNFSVPDRCAACCSRNRRVLWLPPFVSRASRDGALKHDTAIQQFSATICDPFSLKFVLTV